MKCNRDLSECICPDLKERLERLRQCPMVDPRTIIEVPLAQRKLLEEQRKNRPDEKPQNQ